MCIDAHFDCKSSGKSMSVGALEIVLFTYWFVLLFRSDGCFQGTPRSLSIGVHV